MTSSPSGPTDSSPKFSWKKLFHNLLENSAFISTCVAAAVALAAYFLTKGQLETAKLQLIATDRPWIKIEDIRNPTLYIRDKNIDLDSTVVVKNVGKSPALDVQILYKLVTTDIYVPPSDVNYFCINAKGAEDFLGNTIFPDDRQENRISAVLFKPRLSEKPIDDARRLVNKQKYNNSISPKELYRYSYGFSLVICARYKIDQDEKYHYTAQVYDFERVRQSSKTPIDFNSSTFDLSMTKTYKDNDLVVDRPEGNRFAN